MKYLGKVEMVSVVDNIRKARLRLRLRWFCLVEISRNDLVKRCERLIVIGLRRVRSRSKKNWGEVNRQQIEYLQLIEDMTLDRRAWRPRIRVKGQQVVERFLSFRLEYLSCSLFSFLVLSLLFQDPLIHQLYHYCSFSLLSYYFCYQYFSLFFFFWLVISSELLSPCTF